VVALSLALCSARSLLGFLSPSPPAPPPSKKYCHMRSSCLVLSDEETEAQRNSESCAEFQSQSADGIQIQVHAILKPGLCPLPQCYNQQTQSVVTRQGTQDPGEEVHV